MSPRGGKREGAGRPPFHDETMIHTTLRLTREQREKAERIGKGDMAAGVRLALDAYQEPTA